MPLERLGLLGLPRPCLNGAFCLEEMFVPPLGLLVPGGPDSWFSLIGFCSPLCLCYAHRHSTTSLLRHSP